MNPYDRKKGHVKPLVTLDQHMRLFQVLVELLTRKNFKHLLACPYWDNGFYNRIAITKSLAKHIQAKKYWT